MLTIKGKYNFANVMIDEIDDATRNQIQEFLNHPAFANTYISIMPDCHQGKGAVIGFTMKQNNYVIPNIIGVDIGCGMLMGKYDIKNIDLKSLDDYIKKNIPAGFHINSNVSASSNLITYVENICKIIEIDSEKALKAVGSLGGGNHFIEAGIDKNEKLVITIHSGSRNFGKCVAEFYQKKAKENLTKYFIEDQYKNLEFLPIDHQDAQEYLFSMNIAQKFASENRMKTIYLGLRGNFDSSDLKKIIKTAGCKDKQELDDKFKLVYDEYCDCYYIHICQVPFSEILTDSIVSTMESLCKDINHYYFQKIYKQPKDKKLYEYFGFHDCDVDENLKTWEDSLVIFEKETT